jgi:hypothetical protein
MLLYFLCLAEFLQCPIPQNPDAMTYTHISSEYQNPDYQVVNKNNYHQAHLSNGPRAPEVVNEAPSPMEVSPMKQSRYMPYKPVPIPSENSWQELPKQPKMAEEPIEDEQTQLYFEKQPERPRKNTYRNNEGKTVGQRFPNFVFAVRYLFVILIVGVPLAVPMIIYWNISESDALENVQKNLIFYLFTWFEFSWISAIIFNLFWRAFPYIFRFVAGYVNPAHQKYWRVFRSMLFPFTVLFSVIFLFLFFSVVSGQIPIELDRTDNGSLLIRIPLFILIQMLSAGTTILATFYSLAHFGRECTLLRRFWFSTSKSTSTTDRRGSVWITLSAWRMRWPPFTRHLFISLRFSRNHSFSKTLPFATARAMNSVPSKRMSTKSCRRLES